MNKAYQIFLEKIRKKNQVGVPFNDCFPSLVYTQELLTLSIFDNQELFHVLVSFPLILACSNLMNQKM